MKFLSLVLCVVLLATVGCDKDDDIIPDGSLLTSSEQDVQVRRAHELPLKVDFFSTYNNDPNWMPGDPNGWLGGHATHFGNLQSENSPFWYTGPPEESGNPNFPLRVYIFNFLAAANGDIAAAQGYLDINPEIGVFIGHMEIIPHEMNTGKFVGASGYSDITTDNPGQTDPETGMSFWEAEGEIMFQ